jgi:hypothetical protein
MPEEDAVELINWIPDVGGLKSRKGFKEWAIDFPSDNAVQAVFPYYAPSTTFPAGTFTSAPTTMPGKLYAATKAAIYEITSATNTPTSVLALSGTDNAGWIQTALMTNSAGSYLMCCSEDDGYIRYDGTTWAAVTMGAGAGQVSGVNPNTFVQVLIWKKRAWFVERNTTRAWYLPTESIAGAAVSFDFGAVLRSGGHLSFLASWTIDAGEGIDDILVAVGSNGDVALYKGTDPSSPSTFSLQGVWNVGQIPVGRRAYTQYGGDLIIASADGIFPLSFVTRGGAAALQASSKEYSSKIRARIGPALKNTFTTRGWDMLVHPGERLMLINVPYTGPYKNVQYAMNTTLNSWCQLQDIPTYCYGTTGGYVFAGTTDGRVLLLFQGDYDAVEYGATTGYPIYGTVQQAFNTFKSPALTKLFHLVRPQFLADLAPTYIVNMGVDYERVALTEYPPTPTGSLARFGTGVFGTALWGTSSGSYSGDWVGSPGVGVSGSVALNTACIGEATLTAIDYAFETGGPM